jgi:hypothetical protein
MYTKEDFAYKWSDQKLLDELLESQRRGAQAHIWASTYQENSGYLYGAVIARMKGFMPVFNPGDRVKAKGETAFISYSNSDLTRGVRGRRRGFSGVATVEKIYYVVGTGKWEIVFVEKTPETTFQVMTNQDIPLRFMAEDFTIDVQSVLQA